MKVTPSSGSSLPDPGRFQRRPNRKHRPYRSDGRQLHCGTIAVSTPTGGTQERLGFARGRRPATLVPNPGSLIFNAQTGQGNPTNQNITFSSSDNTPESVAIAAVSNSTWLKVLASSSAFATIGVDQTGLATGVYNGIIAVTQAGAANSPVNVPVVLVVNGGGSGGGGGTLTFSPASLSFASVNGSAPASQSLSVSASQHNVVRGSNHQLLPTAPVG